MGIVLLQNSAQPEEGSRPIDKLLEGARARAGDLLVLPELFTETRIKPPALKKLLLHLGGLCRQRSVSLVAGSVYEVQGNQTCNTCFTFNGTGEVVGMYRKVHLSIY